MRNRTSPAQAEELRRIMLDVIRTAGKDGVTAQDAKDRAQEQAPRAESAALGYALRALQRTEAIRGSGETHRRIYVATNLNPEMDPCTRQQARAEIHKFHDLRSFPARPLLMRRVPSWMRPEHQP